MNIIHKTLAEGRWREFSLMEQLGNVGSEVGRARYWQERDQTASKKAMERALELMDMTIRDPRWRNHRLKELRRAREMVVDAMRGGKEYGSTLEDLDEYFFQFAIAARLNT